MTNVYRLKQKKVKVNFVSMKPILLALVVQMLDRAIHRINHYPNPWFIVPFVVGRLNCRIP